jgi:hypothetical protein
MKQARLTICHTCFSGSNPACCTGVSYTIVYSQADGVVCEGPEIVYNC